VNAQAKMNMRILKSNPFDGGGRFVEEDYRKRLLLSDVVDFPLERKGVERCKWQAQKQTNSTIKG
jgi:hypothetical protein